MWCSENGCTDAEVEIRGHWKGKKNGRTVNQYISVEQLTTDAKLASILAAIVAIAKINGFLNKDLILNS